MAAVVNWLRGAFNRFVDDGGLYSTYNGEQPYQVPTPLHVKRVAKHTRSGRWLAPHKV